MFSLMLYYRIYFNVSYGKLYSVLEDKNYYTNPQLIQTKSMDQFLGGRARSHFQPASVSPRGAYPVQLKREQISWMTQVTVVNYHAENTLQGTRDLPDLLKKPELAFQEIEFSLLLFEFTLEEAALGVQLLDLLAEVKDHFDGWK